MNYIEVLKAPENSKVKIKKILDPLIEEEINGGYTFSFVALIDADAMNLKHGATVLVDGETFFISSKSKTRGDYPKLIIECDHISYKLSSDNYLLEETEYETTPRAIIESLLVGSKFTLKDVEFNQVIYFRPGNQSVRGRLIELANFLTGELIFSNYEISLVGKRGTTEGADFETGVNVKSVTENLKTINGRLEQSLEIDIIDLSRLPGREAEKTVNMGDSIGIKDADLEINTRSRVVRRRYNPFKKLTPQISVGRIIPDILEYFRDEEEKEDEEKGYSGAGVTLRGSGGLSVTLKGEETPKLSGINLGGSGGLSISMKEKGDPDGDSEYKDWLTTLTIAGENVLKVPGLDKTDQATTGDGTIKSPPVIEVSKQWGDFILKIPADKKRDYFIRVYAKNLINGRSIKVYTEADFDRYDLKGAGWGPFEIDRETGRYVVEFRTNNGYDLGSIVKAFSFNATLTLPEDLDEWPGEKKPDKKEDRFYIEFGSASLASLMDYEFKEKEGYDTVESVTYGLSGDVGYTSAVSVVFRPTVSGGVITGVQGMSNWSELQDVPDLNVDIQVVCKKAGVVEGVE